MNSWWRCRCMHWPITEPSSTLSAANSVVVPLRCVVVRHGRQPALLERQPRLRPVERLDLRLLVDREHDGVGRRVDVQPDDGAQLGGEARVVGELEGAHPVRLQAVRAPDPLHRAGADADRRRHGRGRSSAWSRPAASPAWSARPPAPPRRRPAAGYATAGSCHAAGPRPPRSMNRSCQRQTATLLVPGPPHDLDRAVTVGRQQHDPRPPDVMRWTPPADGIDVPAWER